MCRIFGVFGHHEVDISALANASAIQKHGGPDEQTIIVKRNWALGIDRLSIEDFWGGGQPYVLNGKITAVFNGEIYNYKELKAYLSSRGYIIESESDGAIIPPLYAEYGVEFIKKLDGMFAVALIDETCVPTLLLASDHLGIKSLYYSLDDHGNIYFASELSGLCAVLNRVPDLDIRKIDFYFAMQSIIGPGTVYRNTQTLAPGTIVTCQWGKNVITKTYVSTDIIGAGQSEESLESAGSRLREKLREEVAQMITTNLPVCSVLSGGVDSSLITALAAKQKANIKAFHITYKAPWFEDERSYALKMATTLGIDLEIIETDPRSFPEMIPTMVHHMGQPNAAPHALSTFILFKAIRSQGFKVAVAGDGSDEQFGAYARFSDAMTDCEPDWFETYLDRLAVCSLSLRTKLYSAEFHGLLSSYGDCRSSIQNMIQNVHWKLRLQDLINFDLYKRFPYFTLRRIDHLSMAHGVEVRVPFCQRGITNLARGLRETLKIEGLKTKRVVLSAAKGVIPQEIIARPKQGFKLPIEVMLRVGEPLFEFVADVVLSLPSKQRGILRPDEVANLVDRQRAEPSVKIAMILWALMILEIWLSQQKQHLTIHSIH
jgi:asparagine synthase (glutamine-hydrolysing)